MVCTSQQGRPQSILYVSWQGTEWGTVLQIAPSQSHMLQRHVQAFPAQQCLVSCQSTAGSSVAHWVVDWRAPWKLHPDGMPALPRRVGGCLACYRLHRVYGHL